MKVKCINIYNEHTKQYEASNHRLTIGKQYVILAVEIYPGKDVLYRMVGDNPDKSPALHNSSQFEIVSGKLSSNWIVYQFKDGTLILSPKAWQSLGFWEDCYDGDPAALEIYKREARIILEEENAL